jgi:aspartyl-tRNA(Asn)/glutamyl-tRNA(Gln) amidotransferase subunit B
VVADFKSGKDTAAMFLLGQVLKKSQGKANPIKVKELMIEKLNQS